MKPILVYLYLPVFLPVLVLLVPQYKVRAFNHCCKESGFFMVFKCREENAALKECLTVHYNDPAFYEECKREYIKEKLEFERTGIPAKNRKQKLPNSM